MARVMGWRRGQAAGSFRHVVNQYRYAETSDGLGAGGSRTSADTGLIRENVRCAIDDLSAKEKDESSDRREMDITHKLVTWYDFDHKIKTGDYFIIQDGTSRRFEVVEIRDPEQRHEVLVLKVREYEAAR